MIEHVTSIDTYLYHYTPSSTARDSIFKNRTLRFSSYSRTNDPKETKTWQFDLGTNENRDLGKYKMNELSSWLSISLKQNAKLACFTMDSGPLSGDYSTDIFKRGFCKPRMWVQYAEEHKGVCLVFNRTKLAERIKAQFAKSKLVLSAPVTYRDRSIVPNFNDQQYMVNVDVLESIGKKAYVDLHLMTHYKRLFFEKMMDWRDENEWRWVVFSESEDDLFLDIEDCIAGVMFGDATNERIIQDIMDQTQSWGLKYMGLKWKNCSPWYDFGNLRYISGINNSLWKAFVPRLQP